MKKALALILAIAMLSTVAFGATFTAWGTVGAGSNDVVYQINPGSQIALDEEMFKAIWEADRTAAWSSNKMTSENFAVTINYKAGAALVTESWGNDDYDYGYFLTFKNDKTAIRDNKADVVISRIYIKLKSTTGTNLTLTLDKDGYRLVCTSLFVHSKDVKDSYAAAFAPVVMGAFDVGYYVYWYNEEADNDPWTVFEDWSDTHSTQDSVNFSNKAIWKSAVVSTNTNDSMYNLTTTDEWTADAYRWDHGMDSANDYEVENASGAGSYMVGYYDSTGASTQNFIYYNNDDDYHMAIEFSLAKGQYVWVQGDNIANHEDLEDVLEEKATAAGADFQYIMYKNGNSAFKTAATASLFADEDQFIYEFDADGNLSKTAFVWDDDMGYYTAKLKGLGNYLVSDVELDVAGAADDTNPDTGANDVVGIASALAVVALISAAAISLKK